MTETDFVVLLPWLIVAATVVVVLLAVAFHRSSALALTLTVTGLLVALAVLSLAGNRAPHLATPLMLVDHFSLFYSGVLIFTSLAVAVMCYAYFRDRLPHHEEVYLLLLSATLGAMTLSASQHFASFFLGLELLSVSLFALLAYPTSRQNQARAPLEAALKYLILSGVSSAFLLFGIALVYMQAGGITLEQIINAVSTLRSSPAMLAGIALILCGIGFKLAVVPFHLWTPDVYQGAPAPISAFIATLSKGAMFIFLVRLLLTAGDHPHATLTTIIAVFAAISIVAGNLLALLQPSIKRLLAYSSIAHLGYMLVPLVAGGRLAGEAIAYYFVGYVITVLGAFAVVSALSTTQRAYTDADDISGYQGLFWNHPVYAVVMTIMLLSLAGIPLTMGFVGKFYVIAAGVDTSYWWLLLVVVAGNTIGLFYYLRIVSVLYTDTDKRLVSVGLHAWPSNSVLTTMTSLLVLMGSYPAPLIRLIQHTAASPASISTLIALKADPTCKAHKAQGSALTKRMQCS